MLENKYFVERLEWEYLLEKFNTLNKRYII